MNESEVFILLLSSSSSLSSHSESFLQLEEEEKVCIFDQSSVSHKVYKNCDQLIERNYIPIRRFFLCFYDKQINFKLFLNRGKYMDNFSLSLFT